MAEHYLHKIYHLADARNWSSIQARGLLSAEQLLIQAKQTDLIQNYRNHTTTLNSGLVIRDQRPIPPHALANCLAPGLTPADWYALLNRYVFFWIDFERLNRQLRACKTSQYILTIDADKLIEQYAPQAAVTPFNVGNARRAAAYRSLSTFVPYNLWTNSRWQSESRLPGSKERPRCHKPVEFTVLNAVPNIIDFIIDCQRVDPIKN